MLFDDQYQTLAGPSEGIFRDKGSKFIAYLYPIRQEEEIKGILADLRSQHSKARHFCWAYRLSPDRNVFRINDDGEPSGSAGRPILNTLLSADVTNVMAVVVRYFGGTLLGIPGLINAYKKATVEALASATIVSKTVNDVYELQFDYLLMNPVMKILKEEQLTVLNQDFNTACSLRFEVRKNELNRVLARLEGLEGLRLQYLFTV